MCVCVCNQDFPGSKQRRPDSPIDPQTLHSPSLSTSALPVYPHHPTFVLLCIFLFEFLGASQQKLCPSPSSCFACISPIFTYFLCISTKEPCSLYFSNISPFISFCPAIHSAFISNLVTALVVSAPVPAIFKC